MAGVEGSTPSRVTVPLELTLAVKERGRAQLEERRTSAAMSGKVAAMNKRKQIQDPLYTFCRYTKHY